MGMGDLKSNYCNTDTFAGDLLFNSESHGFRKREQTGQQIVRDIKDIINLFLGNYQCVPFCKRVDIKECHESIILSYFEAGDFTVNNFCKDTCHHPPFSLEISIISKEIVPAGTRISTLSPTVRPRIPLEIGEFTEILHSLMLDSFSGTRV